MNESTRQSTRRRTLQQGLALAAAAGVPGCATSRKPKRTDVIKQLGYIDAHSHIWTPDTDAFSLTIGRTRDDLDPPSFTAEELLKTVHPHGVEKVVLVQHIYYYGYDNAYMIDAANRFPGTFSIIGSVDSNLLGVADMMRSLSHQHVRGFRIRPNRPGDHAWLTTDGMTNMWKAAVDLNQAICLLIKPDSFDAVEQMCRRFPRTTVVIDHFGRAQSDAELDQLIRLSGYPNVYVKVSGFYQFDTPAYDGLVPRIRKLISHFGANRLMWGSDCPYQLNDGHSYEASIALLRDRAELDDVLTEDALTWILRRTAEKVFFAS